MSGFSSHRCMARWVNAASRARIASAPTDCFSPKTSPARIDSMIAGVPPSSRCSMSSR